MKASPLIIVVALLAATACGHPPPATAPAAGGILDRQDIVTDLEANPAPPTPSPRIFPDHTIDAERVAHAVGTLIASSDAGVVPSYLGEVERETGCGVQIFTGSSASDAASIAKLSANRRRAITRIWQDPTVNHIGGVLMPVVVPFQVEAGAPGAPVDQGWIGVIAVIRCAVGRAGQALGQAPW